MIKKFKIFESINQGEPEVGDYVANLRLNIGLKTKKIYKKY